MNGRTTACLAACAAVLLTAGVIDKAVAHHPAPQPTPPTVSASPAMWMQHLGDARVELESTTTAIRAAHLNGQPIALHQQNCRTAVATYNQAAAHLNVSALNPSKECAP